MKILQTHAQLKRLGITNPNRIYWQLNTPQRQYDDEAIERLIMMLFMVIALQVGGGFLNLVLLAPV
jgi:hypothetical protein